jgi:serine/threonine protein kinase
VGEVQPHEELEFETGERLLPGTPFIAMELIKGKPLDRVLSKSGSLPLDEFLDMAVQVAEGVAEAHAHGIVHRDLKPQNVVVTSKGLVKILDFGLAKPLPPGGPASAESVTVPLTHEGTLVGTTPYMAPEQASGKAVDSRSDVFSFGVMLYELATGKRPFRGENTQEILAKILEAEPVPLSEVRSGLPAELERITRRCLRKKPEERYNDTRDLVAALKDLKETTSTEGLQQSPKPETSKLKKTLFKYALPASVVLLAAVFFVIFGPFRSGIPSEQGPVRLAVLPFKNLGASEDEFFCRRDYRRNHIEAGHYTWPRRDIPDERKKIQEHG